MAQAHADFAQYQQETARWIQAQRHFQSENTAQELLWNMPTEWRPTMSSNKAILLVHGLGDSPWSMVDIGAELAKQGFLVRTVLLAGHGTKPADLLSVHVNDWKETIARQVAVLQKEVDNVYLGGFSTGANLVTSYAIDHPEIRGLVLLSPAFRQQSTSAWLLPYVTWFKPWLRQPTDARAQQTALRYLNTPTNGFLQFYRSSLEVQHKLATTGFDRPAMLVIAQHDSVVDVDFVLQSFVSHFTHPDSRLIWYGTSPHEDSMDNRVLLETDYLPEERISQFSHMGILFSPDNPLYGRTGQERLCQNGQLPEVFIQCLISPREALWYADWGYQEDHRIHARLTFNPYFDWQSDIMSQVLRPHTTHLTQAVQP